MDRIRTTTGRSLRGEGLHETSLPTTYNAATTPGATILGTDGQLYQSLKHNGTYQWRKSQPLTPSGQMVIGRDTPRTEFLIYTGGPSERTLTPQFQCEGSGESNGSVSFTRAENSNDPARLYIAKTRPTTTLPDLSLQDVDAVGWQHFSGSDGYGNLISGAEIQVRVDGIPSLKNVPMSIRFSTLSASDGPTIPLTRMMITSSGNVLINNTSGTEKLTVSGNIRISATSSYMVSSNPVVGARRTGWSAPTGTATRTSFSTTTVTTEQLAERVKGLIDDLIAHGLIGA